MVDTVRNVDRDPGTATCKPGYPSPLMYESAPADDLLRSAGVDPDALRDVLPHVDAAAVSVRVASPLFRRFWAKGIAAVSLPFGVYVQPAVMDRFRIGAEPERSGGLLVHELVHIDQWRRLGAIRHTTQYLGDYLRGRWHRKGHWESYLAIRLEVEARQIAALITREGPR